jgi:hypothetical protein
VALSVLFFHRLFQKVLDGSPSGLSELIRLTGGTPGSVRWCARPGAGCELPAGNRSGHPSQSL